MILSNRIKEIIELIIEQKGFITVDEIAKTLNISSRTVYREIPEITKIFNEYHVELISVSKKGLCASGRMENIKEVLSFVKKENDISFVDANQRADFVLLYILHQSDYVKAEAIALDHRCGLTTIRSDLDKIKQRISKYDVQIISQKGQGIKINGTLIEKNHLIADIILHQVSETDLYSWLEKNEDLTNPFLTRLQDYGYKECIQRVNSSIKNILNSSKLLDNTKTLDYLEIVLLISFMVNSHKDNSPYKNYFQTRSGTLEIALRIKTVLEEEFNMNLSKAETSYVQWILFNGLGKNEYLSTKGQMLNSDMMNFISYIEDMMGINLSKDNELKEGLYAHLEKAIVRVQSNMQISNPALKDIKEKYVELFKIIKEGTRKIFKGVYFPDDEIGYLVLYFALSLDRMTKKIFKVLVVCSGGMGSSKMLANSLEREIPEISVVKTISIILLDQENLDDYDLILSTIPLYLDDEYYLKVSPMLHKNELSQIKEKIRRHKHNVLRRIDSKEKKYEIENEDFIIYVNQITNLALKITRNLKIVSFVSYEDMISKIDTFILNANRIKEYSFLIPTTPIFYYEGIYDHLDEPMVLIFDCVNEKKQEVLEGEYDRAIVVLYSESMDKYESRALKQLIEYMLSDLDFSQSILELDVECIRKRISLFFRESIKAIVNE